jgi:hypothetical protein
MESYLKPLLAEIHQRARLSQEIFLLLQDYLRDREHRGILEIPKINKHWTFFVEKQAVVEAESDQPHPLTEYGVPLQGYLRVGLFLASRLNDDPKADLVPVMDIYVAENGTVISGPSSIVRGQETTDGTFEDDIVAKSFIELNSTELSGLKRDLIGLLLPN